MARDGEGPISREEYEALKKRLRRLEAHLGLQPGDDEPEQQPKPQPEPAAMPWPPVSYATPPPSSQPQPQQPQPVPARAAAAEPRYAADITYAKPPTPPPRPPTPSPSPSLSPLRTPSPRRDVSVESLLGQRWAPRVGALLVFLAALFFLGLGIQRGWIGPLMQLGLAALVAIALLAGGAVLTAKRGYGTYPQVLEGTGAAVLYVTTFVAQAVPYYDEQTNLTPVTGGLLLALVAAGTIALALHRDARVIAGLGYSLSFLTAGLGVAQLPDITLAYVAVLGASLAWVVQRKAWHVEALVGTMVTGALFLVIAGDPTGHGAPAAWWALACAALPLAAFLWLTLQPATVARGDGVVEARFAYPAIAFLTSVWGALLAVLVAGSDPTTQGFSLLTSCAALVGLGVVAYRRRTHAATPTVYGVLATIAYVVWPALLWRSWTDSALLITVTYAGGALACASVAAAWPRLRASLVLLAPGATLAVAATARAILVDDRIAWPWTHAAPGVVVGPWQAWLTFAVLAPAIAMLAWLDFPRARSEHRLPLLSLGVVFAGAWAFALFVEPLAVTACLLALATAALVAALLGRDAPLGRAFAVASLAFLALAAAKAAFFDADLGAPEVYAEGILLAVGVVAFSQGAAAPRVGFARDQRATVQLSAALLFVLGLGLLWRDVEGGRFATTTAYAVVALALGALARARRGDAEGEGEAWVGAVGLGIAAAAHALVFDGKLASPFVISPPFGGLDAWLTLVLVAGALAFATLATGPSRSARRLAFAALVAFLALWSFALFGEPFYVTMTLLVVAGLAAAVVAALPEDAARPALARDAILAALLVLALAALKGATLDRHGPAPEPLVIGAIEAAFTAGALLALHALAKDRLPFDAKTSAVALVGGSALVIANAILAYASGPWVSVLCAIEGVCYLVAGFVRKAEAVLRYTGFALLGFVLVRVFAVDMAETDLAIRALVFAVLGAILLGVGYAYARANRREQAPLPAEIVEDELSR